MHDSNATGSAPASLIPDVAIGRRDAERPAALRAGANGRVEDDSRHLLAVRAADADHGRLRRAAQAGGPSRARMRAAAVATVGNATAS